MGEWLQPKSFKLGRERERKLAEIQEALHPFVENRSQTMRWVIDTMHILIFRQGILENLTRAMQGLLRNTAYYPAAPPKRVAAARLLTPDEIASQQPRSRVEVLVQILIEAVGAKTAKQAEFRFA